MFINITSFNTVFYCSPFLILISLLNCEIGNLPRYCSNYVFVFVQETSPSPLALLAATCSKIGNVSVPMQQQQSLPQEEAQEGSLATPQEQQFTLPSGQQIRIVNAALLQQLQAVQQQAIQHQQLQQQQAAQQQAAQQAAQQQAVQQQQLQQQQLAESNAMAVAPMKRDTSSPSPSPQANVNGQTQLMTLQQLQSFLPQHMQLTNAATSQAQIVDAGQAAREVKPSVVSLQNVPSQFIQVS